MINEIADKDWWDGDLEIEDWGSLLDVWEYEFRKKGVGVAEDSGEEREWVGGKEREHGLLKGGLFLGAVVREWGGNMGRGFKLEELREGQCEKLMLG